jgi:uncharacterized protein (TIGR02466 family)
MESKIIPAFPTLIGRFQIPDAEPMNRELRLLIMNEASACPALGRSNVGGWHSRPDLLHKLNPAMFAMTGWLKWALRRMVDASSGGDRYTGTPSVSAWATICRTGAYHAPHSHPDSAWSGVYYVDAGTPSPEQPLSGVLEFLDPRNGAEALPRPGDPYGEPLRIQPQSGLLVVFPSWLYHWVHPYAGKAPRIAISFNAAMPASTEINARSGAAAA